MYSPEQKFKEEITRNREEKLLTDTKTVALKTPLSRLQIRERGCYITEAALFSPTFDEVIPVLFSDSNISIPKLTASHPMTPVGPYDGIGGQHGFARWADYHAFYLDAEDDSTESVSMQAKRIDGGLTLTKVFELTDSTLTTKAIAQNPSDTPHRTSIGEHLYFMLSKENFSGLTINGHTLDELLGDGAEEQIKQGMPLYWGDYPGSAAILFPDGYELRIKNTATQTQADQIGMLIWHRPGTPSICFEPTLGFTQSQDQGSLVVAPFDFIALHTSIELL